MSRYIDADKLRKDEIKRCHCVPLVGSGDNNYKNLDEVLNEAPTANVVEVIHGEWKIMKMGDGERVRTCSSCLISQSVNVYKGKVMFRYCPYCGAKMDGERKDTE